MLSKALISLFVLSAGAFVAGAAPPANQARADRECTLSSYVHARTTHRSLPQKPWASTFRDVRTTISYLTAPQDRYTHSCFRSARDHGQLAQRRRASPIRCRGKHRQGRCRQ